MMKLSKKKVLLSFLCVFVLCSVFGILILKHNFVSKTIAKGTEDYAGTDVETAMVNCGSNGATYKEIMENYFGLSGQFALKPDNPKEFELNHLIISVENGEFESNDSISTIVSNAYDYEVGFSYIKSICTGAGETGKCYSGDEHIEVSKGNSLHVTLNPSNHDTFNPENPNYDPRTIKIMFHLKSDYVYDKDNNYGCVSEQSMAALNAAQAAGNYNEELAKHPTLRDKPTNPDECSAAGCDVGTYYGGVVFSAPLITGNNDHMIANNFHDLCSDFKGYSSGHLSSDAIAKRDVIFSRFDKYADKDDKYKSYRSSYQVCDEEYVSSYYERDTVKKDLEMLIDAYYNGFSETSIKSKDASLDWFNDELFDKIREKGENYTSDTINLKCSSDTSIGDFKSKFLSSTEVDGKSTYNIKANSSYFYHSEETLEEKFVTLNYTSGSESVSVGNCKTICEEAVVVDYGPPIASTAGLCFEYQVQVTSKVKCSSIPSFHVPTFTLCNPVPYCNSIPGYVHQAGPKQEFESCVNECDGGKFTEKCSEKCYDKVYSKPKNKFLKQTFDTTVNYAKKVKDCSCSGSYYVSGGSVGWSGSGFARWYCDAEPGRTSHDCYGTDSLGATYYPDNGFKRADYGGSICHESCYFSDPCGGHGYYNEAERKSDEETIPNKIHELEEECKAKASCTEKTAGFTINVSYVYDEKDKSGSVVEADKKVTISFPYSKPPTETDAYETLLTSGNSSKCTGDTSSYFTDDKMHTILAYAGCYKNCGTDIAYHTRWSFPGGWTNDKSNDISYVPTKGSGWTRFPDKFCMPANAKATNSGFYYLYYTHINPARLKDWQKAKAIWPPTDGSSIDYNINAIAKNFGHYGWNFNISCYYALPEPECKDCDKSPLSVDLRTIDLENIFPNRDGKIKNNPDGFNIVDDKLPFNWSSRAVQNNKPLETVAFDPLTYGKFVQTNGQSIYNDEELEYHFHLTPATMRAFNSKSYELRSNGKVITTNGVKAYVSGLFRNGELKSSAIRVPREGVLGCNNIRNVKDGSGSGDCYTIDDIKKAVK